jgi:hypothetical protein
VKKKKLLTAAFITVILLSAVAGTQIELGSSNPYIHEDVWEGEVPAPDGIKPPEILVLSPKNNTLFTSRNISLNFNVSVPKLSNVTWWGPLSLFYQGSWQSAKTIMNTESLYRRYNNTFPFNIVVNFTDVPEGPRWVTVNATSTGFGGWTHIGYDESGSYPRAYDYYVTFNVTTQVVVNFTVDTTVPKVSILTLENKTYSTPDVILNFTVDEAVSQVAYSLDGQDNMTISGNTTLNDLSAGEHYVTVYATDLAGHVGISKTIFFNVAEPFPTMLVIASVITVSVVGVGLLVYFKKRKH